MTDLVVTLGFIPMAIATEIGAVRYPDYVNSKKIPT
jgi:hypothetical protein